MVGMVARLGSGIVSTPIVNINTVIISVGNSWIIKITAYNFYCADCVGVMKLIAWKALKERQVVMVVLFFVATFCREFIHLNMVIISFWS